MHSFWGSDARYTCEMCKATTFVVVSGLTRPSFVLHSAVLVCLFVAVGWLCKYGSSLCSSGMVYADAGESESPPL